MNLSLTYVSAPDLHLQELSIEYLKIVRLRYLN